MKVYAACDQEPVNKNTVLSERRTNYLSKKQQQHIYRITILKHAYTALCIWIIYFSSTLLYKSPISFSILTEKQIENHLSLFKGSKEHFS